MRLSTKRVLVSTLVLLMVVTSLVGCKGGAKQDRALTIALPGEPQTLDPYAHSNQNGFICTTLVFEPLIKKDDNGEFYPWLATEWEFLDDTTLRFKLRDDVTFHDGSKFTAEDVLYSLAVAAESSFTKNLFGCLDIAGSVIHDPTTIDVKLKYAYAPILEALASHRGAMISKAVYEASSREELGRKPIGTGPMRFANWFAGDRIELETYQNYWGEPLAFDKFTARFIVEAASRSIELETGGVDIAFDLAPADWERIDKGANTQLIGGKTHGISFLCFNNSMPLFSDIRVRKALAHALDLESLVKTVWQGQADVADSYYSPNIFGYKKLGPWEYNPEKAKALLMEAGYADGLDITYITYESRVNLAFAEVIENMWKQVGVNTTVQVVDLATFTTMNNNGEIPVSLMTNTAVIPDPDAALLAWPTHRTISLRHNDGHVDELLEKGKMSYDQEERSAVYQELQDYLWSKLYTLPVAYPKSAYGASSRIENLPFYPNLCPDLTRIRFAE
ncbi:MAG: ABC transporter substrate-binding protein [Firmicutes bacterium]|nr:ABC transporter substrate-binding protein [Bacillota bacterium]